MKKIYIIVGSLIAVVIIITINSRGFFKNRYKLLDFHSRIVEIGGENDSLNCPIAYPFTGDESREWAISFKMKVEFYSDSSVRAGRNVTMALGRDGSREKIHNLNVSLIDTISGKIFNISNLLYGDSIIEGISTQSSNINRSNYFLSKQGCVKSEYFEDLKDFVRNFNNNNKEKVTGERLVLNETLLYFDKKLIPDGIKNSKHLIVKMEYELK